MLASRTTLASHMAHALDASLAHGMPLTLASHMAHEPAAGLAHGARP
jgi:hypothetical protein